MACHNCCSRSVVRDQTAALMVSVVGPAMFRLALLVLSAATPSSASAAARACATTAGSIGGAGVAARGSAP